MTSLGLALAPQDDNRAVLTPRRRRGIELLDDPNIDPAVREQSIGDVTRANRWLGGLRAASIELRDALRDRSAATVLDVGTGLGDIPACVADEASHCAVVTIGVDEAPSLLAAARSRMTYGVCANGLALPFRDRSVDVVLCSQVLHHFEGRRCPTTRERAAPRRARRRHH